MNDAKRDFLIAALVAEKWNPDGAATYVDHYLAGGLDHENLGGPAYEAIARALCRFHQTTIDSWHEVAPSLREHLRQQAYAAGGEDAVKLGAALETMAALVATAPPPGASPPGPASRLSGLSDAGPSLDMGHGTR